MDPPQNKKPPQKAPLVPHRMGPTHWKPYLMRVNNEVEPSVDPTLKWTPPNKKDPPHKRTPSQRMDPPQNIIKPTPPKNPLLPHKMIPIHWKSHLTRVDDEVEPVEP